MCMEMNTFVLLNLIEIKNKYFLFYIVLLFIYKTPKSYISVGKLYIKTIQCIYTPVYVRRIRRSSEIYYIDLYIIEIHIQISLVIELK